MPLSPAAVSAVTPSVIAADSAVTAVTAVAAVFAAFGTSTGTGAADVAAAAKRRRRAPPCPPAAAAPIGTNPLTLISSKVMPRRIGGRPALSCPRRIIASRVIVSALIVCCLKGMSATAAAAAPPPPMLPSPAPVASAGRSVRSSGRRSGRRGARFETAGCQPNPSSSKRAATTSAVGARSFSSASSRSRSPISPESSRTQRSRLARVSRGPRADSRLPPKFLDEPTCFASRRSSTAAGSSPAAIRHAIAACSSGCAHSPRKMRATAAAPACRSAPAVSKPASPSSGRPDRSNSPSLPPKPRSLSTGSGSRSACTACGGSSVSWSCY